MIHSRRREIGELEIIAEPICSQPVPNWYAAVLKARCCCKALLSLQRRRGEGVQRGGGEI
jgi:hypothetical protein